MNIEQILQNYPFFNSLGENTRESMLEEARIVTLEKNAPYFNEGDTCSNILGSEHARFRSADIIQLSEV